MRYSISAMLLMVFLLAGCGGPPPSDTILLSRFEENQEAFQELADMIIEDRSLERVHRTYIRGTSPGDERLAEYRRLLETVGCLAVSRYDHQDQAEVEITAFAGGALPDEGMYKGFKFFSRGLPERFTHNVVSSLDEDPNKSETGPILHRRINENWYLYFLY